MMLLQTLRRLAQNREAARKSRLRKKVSSFLYYLFLNSSAIAFWSYMLELGVTKCPISYLVLVVNNHGW